jgi:hypothetical protein
VAKTYAGAEPPVSQPGVPPWVATSGAAGGPSAAMPTATVWLVAAASDDRKRGTRQLRAACAAVFNGRQRMSRAQKRADGARDQKHTIGVFGRPRMRAIRAPGRTVG